MRRESHDWCWIDEFNNTDSNFFAKKKKTSKQWTRAPLHKSPTKQRRQKKLRNAPHFTEPPTKIRELTKFMERTQQTQYSQHDLRAKTCFLMSTRIGQRQRINDAKKQSFIRNISHNQTNKKEKGEKNWIFEKWRRSWPSCGDQRRPWKLV